MGCQHLFGVDLLATYRV